MQVFSCPPGDQLDMEVSWSMLITPKMSCWITYLKRKKSHATDSGIEKRNRKNIVNDCQDNRMGSKAMVKSVQEYWHDDNDVRGWREGQCFVFKRASAQHCWAADREGQIRKQENASIPNSNWVDLKLLYLGKR